MRDEYLELFIDNMGEATSRREVPASSIDKYRGVLPDRLLAYWQQEGWAGYAGGRFWTVDPDEYTPLLREWIKRSELADIDDYHVIGRTGFGTFYLWGQRYHRKVTVSCTDNWVLAMKDEAQTPNPDPDRSLSVFFAMAEPDDFDFEDIQENYLFERAVKTLGPLSESEMYGFVPALIAGGEARIESLQKLDMGVHLMILHQLSHG
ncbi:MAG: DUF1851 domain-containing protein [Chitinophagaceae bacterium]|nr:MAG: DUF1851 domain-containing protein [Chitinophagaceae bacterium]